MVLGDSQNASQLLPVFENNKIKAYQGAQNEYPRLLLKVYWGLMKQNDRSAQETVHYWQLFTCNPEPGDVRFTNDSSQNQLFGELNRLKQHFQNLQILNLNSLSDAGQSLKIARYLLLWWMNSLSGRGVSLCWKVVGTKDQMKKHYSRTGKILNNGASKMGIAQASQQHENTQHKTLNNVDCTCNSPCNTSSTEQCQSTIL